MKNCNLSATKKLNNHVPIFICSRECTRSMQKNEVNPLNHLYVSDITGSEMKKSRHIYRTNDIIGALLQVSVTTDCSQASFVGKSWRLSSTSPYQCKPGRPRSDLSGRWPTVLPEDGSNLSYSPHVILIDSTVKY